MIYIHWAILLIYAAIVIATMVAVLMDNRQPVKTMAWLLVLWFLPVVGIVLYIFFGQDTRKEHLISQRSLDQLAKRSMLEFVEQDGLQVPDEHRTLIRLFANQSWAFFNDTATTEIYTDGYAFVFALLRAFGEARDHIHLDTFIIEDDPLGNLIADALIDKALAGVEVRVVYDDVGCFSVPDRFFERMRDAGVEVHPFMPVRFPAFTSKMNYRNHRKLCVVDGRVGFIGGMNLALRYVKGTPAQPWRDTHLRVEGGLVYAIQRAFLVDWYFVDRTLITNRKYYPPIPDGLRNDCLAQIVTSSPISPWPDIMQGYVRILMEAREYVYLESPYFLPTEPVLFALRTAALAGIDVRLIVPLRGDSRVVDLAQRSFLYEAVAAGVKVFLYQAGFNHSKLLVSDDTLCSCGSTNVDFRSFEHNFEANAFFYDRAMTARMKQVFLDDLARSVPFDEVAKYAHRTFLKRLGESALRLLSPLL